MNTCPRCGSVLITHEKLQAIDGKLYCSRGCTLRDLADRFLQDENTAKRLNDAWNIAVDYFNDCSEEVSSEDVLDEDLQSVQIAVTYFKTVNVPKCITREKALEVVEKMWNDGKVNAEPDDCDEVSFACELVDKDNSLHRYY